MIVEGRRLFLHALDTSFLDSYYKAAQVSFDDLKPVTPGLKHPISLKETSLFFDRTLQQMQNNELFAFVAVQKETQTLVGFISSFLVDWLNQKTEIGFWISSPYTGQGYASEAIFLMLDFLFTHCQLHRVCAKTPFHNARNRHLLEKMRFQFEGELSEALLIENSWKNLALYSLLISNYKNNRTELARHILNGKYPKIKF